MARFEILIVDDNLDLAEGLAWVLEDEGCGVTLVASGEEALERVSERRFDMVLMDFSLPGIDGIEALRRVRRIDPEARVLVMTGYRVEQLLAKAAGQAPTAVLRKPFSVERGVAALEEMNRTGILLVADDTPGLGEAARRGFVERGRHALLVNSPDELEAVIGDTAAPELLILDLGQPVTCALELYLELRDRGLGQAVMIVANGEAGEGDGDMLHAPEVTGCLFKPFEPEVLLTLIADGAVCGA